MGWLQARMDEAQTQAAARRGGAPAAPATASATSGVASTEGDADAEPQSPVRVTGTNRGNRAKRGKGGAYKTTKPPTANGTEAVHANGQEEAEAVPASGRAIVIPRKARPAANDGS